MNLCYNGILVIIVVLVILKMSPRHDTILFIIKKTLNYLIYNLSKIIARLGFIEMELFTQDITTFNGIKKFQNKAPTFLTYYDQYYIDNYLKKNPNITKSDFKRFYFYITSLININIDNYFSTSSDTMGTYFNDNEISKIKEYILMRLNNGEYKINNLIIENQPKYYMNFNGKEIDPIMISFEYEHFGKFHLYIILSIRNDIKINSEYIVINDIKFLDNHQIGFYKPSFVSDLNKTISNVINTEYEIYAPDKNVFNYN
jgi:hypothetical protein